MATLYVTESPGMARDGNGNYMPVFQETPTHMQTVTFTSAAQSNAFAHDTRVIRVYGSAAFNMAIGPNPTATAASPRYAATTEYFRAVRPGDKLSVYDGST